MWPHIRFSDCDITLVNCRLVGVELQEEQKILISESHLLSSKLPSCVLDELLINNRAHVSFLINSSTRIQAHASPKWDPPPQPPSSLLLLLFFPQPAALSCMSWTSGSLANMLAQSVRCDGGRIGGWLMNSCLLPSSNRLRQLMGGCEGLTAHGGLASTGLFLCGSRFWSLRI